MLTLTLISVAGYSRYMRSSAIDTLAQEYLRVVRAKGLPERLVLFRHVLRNSLVASAQVIRYAVPRDANCSPSVVAPLSGGVLTQAVLRHSQAEKRPPGDRRPL